MPNELKKQEQSDDSDSEESATEPQNQVKTIPAITSVAVPSPGTLNKKLLDWESKATGASASTIADALLTPLANEAFGMRSGGEPLPPTDKTQISTKREQHGPSSIGTFNRKTVRKRPPRIVVSGCLDNDKPAIHEYQCSKCLSVDICPVGKQSGIVPKYHSTPPEDQMNYKCKMCSCRTMKRREVTKKGLGGLVRCTRLSMSDSESGSSVVSLKRKRMSPSVDHGTKKIKSEVKPIGIVEKKEDSIDHFGKYVTALLRGVPKKRAFRLQKEIISLVLEDRMRMSSDSD